MKRLLITLFLVLWAAGAQAAWTLMSVADGNFTAAATWQVVDESTSSKLDSEAGSGAPGTSWTDSSAWSPGTNVTVDGVAVKVSAKGTQTGTLSVGITNVGVDFYANQTVNVSDIPESTDAAYNHGWFFFKFASPIVLTNGQNYKVTARLSAANEILLYRDATTANWSRMIRTTTTQAPAAGDQLVICGEHTGAGAMTSKAVCLDNTATTVWGSTSYPQSIIISKGGTLYATNTVAANLYWDGIMMVTESGNFNSTNLLAGGSLVMQMDSAGDVEAGLYINNGGRMDLQGAAKLPWTYLVTDEAVGSTTIEVAAATGWANNDYVCLASTTRTYTECESKQATGVVGTTLTVGALAAAHSGTAPTRAEVGNLTRTCTIQGASSTLSGYVYNAAAGWLYATNAEFKWLGSSAVGKRGIDNYSTVGTMQTVQCSLHDFDASGNSCGIASQVNCNLVTISNVLYNTGQYGIVTSTHTADGAINLTGNLLIYSTSTSGDLIYIPDAGATVTGNTCAGSARYGINLSEAATHTGVFSNNTAHSCNSIGVYGATLYGLNGSGLTVWRNNSIGIRMDYLIGNVSDLTVFGNNIRNILNYSSILTFSNAVVNSDATFATERGLDADMASRIMLRNCSFGATTAHTVRDLYSTVGGQIKAQNTTLASGTEVSFGNYSVSSDNFMISRKHDGTAGANYFWLPPTTYGFVDSVLAFARTAPTSLRVVPGVSGTIITKVRPPDELCWGVAVASNAVATVSAYVRESVVGDGTDYNGARPRLMVYMNTPAGLNADTVIATATVACEGAYELLTGNLPAPTCDTVYRVWIDCDGTTGWINVDDFSVVNSNKVGGFEYADGFPLVWSETPPTAGKAFAQ